MHIAYLVLSTVNCKYLLYSCCSTKYQWSKQSLLCSTSIENINSVMLHNTKPSEAIKYAFATVAGRGDGGVAVGHRGRAGPDTHYPM